MKTKTFEIRDAGTFIPALAVKLDPGTKADLYLLAKAGFGLTPDQQGEYVILLNLNSGQGKYTCDPYDWVGNRTMRVAHQHIIENFDYWPSGSVVDVEFLLGLRTAPKRSEREVVEP